MSADASISVPPHPRCLAAPAARPRAKQADPSQPERMPQERRRYERAAVRMQVHAVTAEGVVHCTADNLSAGGALLCGAPAIEVGSDLIVVLRLRGHPWHVRARVLRVQRDEQGQPVLAVTFPMIAPRVQDLIQGYVLSQLRQEGRAS